MPMSQRKGNFALSFARCKSGAATIEAVLWMPVFIVFFGLLTDTSTIFGREAQILQIVQNANRSLAVGHFQTTAEAKIYIQNQVEVFSLHSTVAVVINKGIISSSVSLPAADLAATGLLNAFSGITLVIAASIMSEA